MHELKKLAAIRAKHNKEKSSIGRCLFCGYTGKTDYYRGMHHCMKCNRIVQLDWRDND